MGKVSEVGAGEFLRMDILKLKPTQFAVGMRQVKISSRKMARLGKLRLRKLVRRKSIPAVIGPGDLLYIVDHHHLAVPRHRLGERQAWIEVMEDWSNISQVAFWKRMKKRNWVHLHDCEGRGPRAYQRLPVSIAQLKDDSYRSLAWAVRKHGGYFKSSKPFSDFIWAGFFLEKLPSLDRLSFTRCLKKALRLAESDEAQGLPGYARFE